MTSKHSPKMAATDSVRSDWNSVATYGALNSPKLHVHRSPLRSPTICKLDPMECASPHRSPPVKADSGTGSPIPAHLTLDRKPTLDRKVTLDRKARVSDKSTCEGGQGGSLEDSIHSSGFLTPPSRNSSTSHSDHVGARARLPPPMSTPPGKKIVAETADKWHWLRYPKLRLSDYQLKSYLWLPVSKQDPRPARVIKQDPRPTRVKSRRTSSLAQNRKKQRNKSVSFSFGDVKQSVDRMRSLPVTPSISRRWSSTGLDQAITRGGSVVENYVAAQRRRTIPFTDRGAEALTAIKERLTRRDIYAHQMDTPTIITLRRASAVLGTLAQRQSSMTITGDPAPNLPDKWSQACNEVPLAAYLITADEIHTLAALIRRTFADGTPQESSKALETVGEDGQKPKEKKPRSGSLISLGKELQERKFPANVAITVADVHSISRTGTMSRKGTFMSQMSRKTSIVSTLLSRKSVHEIIWEDDGTPQSLRSSTWNLSHDPLKNNVATWSSNSFRRESGESGISITAKQETTPSSGSSSPGKKSARPPTFKPVFTTPPKFKKKFESKYSPRPHWKKGSIHELPFPGVLPQADDGPIPTSMPIPIDDVVSFPPLPIRAHTRDWQIPPTDINTPVETPAEEIPNIFLRHPSVTHSMHLWLDEGDSEEEEDENKLYRYGIDATIAPKVSRISATAPTTPNPTIKTTLWGSDAPSRNAPQQQRRRSSAMPRPNILKKQLSNSRLAPNMGSKVGASSGARRRSSTHISIVTAPVEHEEGRAPWRKVRKDSGYPGPAGLAPPSSDEGSDVSGSGEEGEVVPTERTKLLDKGKGKEKLRGMTGMVLQLPSTLRKIRTGSKAGLKTMGGTRVTEENEDEIEQERKLWALEKARSPSPTRKNFQITFPKRPTPGTTKVGCGGANCSRSSCGDSRPGSLKGSQSGSPVKRKASSDGSTFSVERTKSGTYVWGSGRADEPVKKV